MPQVTLLKNLLHVAFSKVMQIVDKINGEIKIVQSVLQLITGNITPNLESWKGDDADAFREEINRVIVPNIERISQILTGLPTGLDNACTTLEKADQKASQIAEEISSEFGNIFNR